MAVHQPGTSAPAKECTQLTDLVIARGRLPRVGVEHSVDVLRRDAIKLQVADDSNEPSQRGLLTFDGGWLKPSGSAVRLITAGGFGDAQFHVMPSLIAGYHVPVLCHVAWLLNELSHRL